MIVFQRWSPVVHMQCLVPDTSLLRLGSSVPVHVSCQKRLSLTVRDSGIQLLCFSFRSNHLLTPSIYHEAIRTEFINALKTEACRPQAPSAASTSLHIVHASLEYSSKRLYFIHRVRDVHHGVTQVYPASTTKTMSLAPSFGNDLFGIRERQRNVP